MIIRNSLGVVLAFVLALGASIAAAATATESAPTLQNMTVQEFLDYHASLQRDLQSRKFDHVSNRDRLAIEAAQNEIRTALAGQSDIQALPQEARVAVFNAHEKVVAIMNEANLDRVTCKREHQLGSHRPRTVCFTERELREMTARNRHERMRSGGCEGPSCQGN
jgi:hypothetical protein